MNGRLAGTASQHMKPPTASNNNASPVWRGRVVLAKHSLFDPHYGMFLSLLYILIVKWTTLIFQFETVPPARCETEITEQLF